jgi:hypothetical protein
VAHLQQQDDVYAFWCDEDHDDWFDANLACDNIVARQWQETSPESGNWDPIPATSLDEIVNTPAELESMPEGGIWLGQDTTGELVGYFVSADGSVAGAELRLQVVQQNNVDGSRMMLMDAPVSLVNVGGVDIIEFDIPADIADMMPMEKHSRFVFAESNLEGGDSYVRQGARLHAGIAETSVVFNSSAMTAIRDGFSPAAP